jgi:predicted nucleic acid-binding protein
VIYLDSSALLAQLLAEDRRPPESLWAETVVTSRLLEYEVWNCINGLGLAKTHRVLAEGAMARLAFLELDRAVLVRATEPFPIRVRTLDAIHLASMEFLRQRGQRPRLAAYDQRLIQAAVRLDFEVVPL